jgi:hypothetical protein
MTIDPTIQQWQNSRHEIGMIKFSGGGDALKRFPHPIPRGFTPIGTAESELLCIEEVTDELVLFEHEVADRISCRCAASQERFVAALGILEDYFNLCGESEDSFNDEAAGLAAVARAAEAAGGSRYEPMYHSMVGF